LPPTSGKSGKLSYGSGGVGASHILSASCSRATGTLMTFADHAMGMTCWYANERQPQATVQLDMHFVDAVQVGEFVEAKCQVVRRTRSLVFMSGELMVGDRVVATAKGCGRRSERGE
jgi:acyl-coenzyme A thioesterase PaaI-like protein